MTKSFNCASCAAPLEFEGTTIQKCRYCGSTVIAPPGVILLCGRVRRFLVSHWEGGEDRRENGDLFIAARPYVLKQKLTF